MSDEPPSCDLVVEGGWVGLDLDLDLDDVVARALAATWRHAPRRPGGAGTEVTVRCTDDATMAALNATWRGKHGPTDVLSFPTTNPGDPWPSAPLLLGDVVLGYGTCRDDAAALGRPLVEHVTHLVVHGLLHLLHFDHETAAGARAMEDLEVRILADLGLPDPYRGRPLLEETD